MSKSRYSEEAAVQIPAGELLRDKLGWDLFYCYDDEVLGIDGTRTDCATVFGFEYPQNNHFVAAEEQVFLKRLIVSRLL